LTVDWKGLTQRGEARTNYTLRAGDRVFLESRDVRKAPAELPARIDAEGGFEAVVPEGATIRAAPDTKVKFTQVKTGRGNRVRLEMAGVVIEAPRLRLKSKEFISEVEATEGDAFQIRSYPAGK
jgi:hypothetical protein